MLYILLISALIANGLRSEGAILRLNESEYYRMPPLYLLDKYDECLSEPTGTYCLVDIQLLPGKYYDLFHMIKEYSNNTLKHFNHLEVHRGICVSKLCREFLTGDEFSRDINYTNQLIPLEIVNANASRNQSNLWKSIEQCLNYSLSREFDLEGKLNRINYCNRHEERPKKRGAEIAVAVIVLVILILNIAGSLYDTIYKNGNQILVCFSLQRNYRKLMGDGEQKNTGDERLQCFKGFQGMRFMTMVAVMFSHSVLVIATAYVQNPLYIETAYDDPLKQLLFNGSLVIQTFFSMSSFLLAYNFMLFTEKHKFNLWFYPQGILNRYLRLTPLYALILAVAATWVPQFGSGALWDLVVTREAQACRQSWWGNILYINNHMSLQNSCMLQTWYLATDSQLFLYGLALMMIIWRFPNSPKVLFPLLLMLNIAVPAVITYANHYYPIVAQRPETYRDTYASDDTFPNVYIPAYTNAGGYTLGLLAGYLHYALQQRNVVLADYKIFRIVFHCLVPTAIAIVLSGGFFYRDNYEYEPIGAAIYAGLYKNLFSITLNWFILGISNKVGTLARACVEWQPFQVVGRLTFCAYLLHVFFLRAFVGMLVEPFHMTDYNIAFLLAGTATITYMSALPVSLLVELPAYNLQKNIFGRNSRSGNNQNSRKHQFDSNLTQSKIEQGLENATHSKL